MPSCTHKSHVPASRSYGGITLPDDEAFTACALADGNPCTNLDGDRPEACPAMIATKRLCPVCMRGGRETTLRSNGTDDYCPMCENTDLTANYTSSIMDHLRELRGSYDLLEEEYQNLADRSKAQRERLDRLEKAQAHIAETIKGVAA